MLRTLFQKNSPQVAVMGAFRTGTNYVRFLLEQNFQCRILYDAYGWKHGGVPVVTRYSGLAYPSIPVVYVVKHPAAFITSLYDYFIDKNRNIAAPTDWASFLREPLVIFDSKPEESSQMRFANPMQYWNFIYWNLSTLPAARFQSFGLRYETVLENPQGEIGRVAEALGLHRKSEGFSLPEGKLARMNDKQRFEPQKAVTTETFNAVLYRNNSYLNRYADADLDVLRAELDPQLMARFDYQL
jgi:hypothetical protein